jgi:hypothetical protein
MSDLDLCEQPQATQQSVLNRSGKDKFILVLNLPDVLKKDSLVNKLLTINPLQVSIYGAVVPNIQIPSVQAPFAGQVLNVTSYSRPNYAPLGVSFVVDNNFKNYWILWKWLTIFNDPKEGIYTGTDIELETWEDRLRSGVLTEYQANFSVFGLNEYNQKTIEFKYYNAFITNLGGITYNYREPELIESTAEFQFSQFDVKLLNN